MPGTPQLFTPKPLGPHPASKQAIVPDNTTGNPAKKDWSDYKVIDCIRLIAICSVVWGHCSLGIENKTFHSATDIIFQSISQQAGRSGTILFFLIAGIVLQQKLQRLTVTTFIKSRLKPIVYPWLIAVGLFCLLMYLNTQQLIEIPSGAMMGQRGANFIAVLKATIFYSTYWFIIVYFISAFLLISIKKYISNLYTGIILGMVTLFYCVNLYYGWVSVYHTKAFFAYTFIMWAGVRIGANLSRVKEAAARAPWVLLITLFIVTGALACFEGFALNQKLNPDAYASTRATNIIHSFVLFACLLKLGNIPVIERLNPRKFTYHIYLVHVLIIYELTMALYKYTNILKVTTFWQLLTMQSIFFVVVLTSSYFFIKFYKSVYAYILQLFYRQKMVVVQ